MIGFAILGCVALILSLTGCKKGNTALTVTGQCLGAAVFISVFWVLLSK